MEGNVEAGAEGLEVASVRLVAYIFHADVEGLDGETGDMDTRTTSEELQEAEGVLATRQTDEDAVTLVDELVLSQRLVECLPKSFLECHGFYVQHAGLFHENQIDGTDDEEERQDVVPVQVGALEQDVGDDGEDTQRDALLDDLQLYQIEGSAIALKTDAVGWHLTAILEKGDGP